MAQPVTRINLRRAGLRPGRQFVSNLTALGTNTTFTTNAIAAPRFLRVFRQP